MELRDRSIVITGAGSGIGRALARRFAAQQPRAQILADINAEAVKEVAREVDGIAVRCDVGIRDQVLTLVDTAREHAGPIDLFFSNAGISGPSGGPVGLDHDGWDASWRVNVMSHIWAAEALLPDMLARGEGYLASTASAGGILTTPGLLAYSVTKHAAVAFAEVGDNERWLRGMRRVLREVGEGSVHPHTEERGHV